MNFGRTKLYTIHNRVLKKRQVLLVEGGRISGEGKTQRQITTGSRKGKVNDSAKLDFRIHTVGLGEVQV